MNGAATAVAYGPLARAIDAPAPGWPDRLVQVNPDLAFKRLWFGTRTDTALRVHVENRGQHLAAVANAASSVPEELVTALRARRRVAAADAATRPGWRALRARITPHARVLVGHGESTIQDSSLTFSTVHGLPMWPGSALKGVAAAQARVIGRPDLVRLFGGPRPGTKEDDAPARQGAVTVFDALPAAVPEVVVDVLTPHVPDYYQQVNTDVNTVTVPPAEYHNPNPVQFLAVQNTTFETHLIGPADDVAEVADLLRAGADDLGIGGKTAAGYGYCTVTVTSE